MTLTPFSLFKSIGTQVYEGQFLSLKTLPGWILQPKAKINRFIYNFILDFAHAIVKFITFYIKGKKSYNFKKREKKLAIYVNLLYFDLFTT